MNSLKSENTTASSKLQEEIGNLQKEAGLKAEEINEKVKTINQVRNVSLSLSLKKLVDINSILLLPHSQFLSLSLEKLVEINSILLFPDSPFKNMQ